MHLNDGVVDGRKPGCHLGGTTVVQEEVKREKGGDVSAARQCTLLRGGDGTQARAGSGGGGGGAAIGHASNSIFSSSSSSSIFSSSSSSPSSSSSSTCTWRVGACRVAAWVPCWCMACPWQGWGRRGWAPRPSATGQRPATRHHRPSTAASAVLRVPRTEAIPLLDAGGGAGLVGGRRGLWVWPSALSRACGRWQRASGRQLRKDAAGALRPFFFALFRYIVTRSIREVRRCVLTRLRVVRRRAAQQRPVAAAA